MAQEIKIVQLAVSMPFVDGPQMLQNIERYGRICYKSEELITTGSADKFVRNLIRRGHESVLEHEIIRAFVTCDRGVSHEIVRHRIASYSQESTRYCDYSQKGVSGIRVIDIHDHLTSEQFDDGAHAIWVKAMEQAAQAYSDLRDIGVSPQIARSVLPNSLKTEIVMTMNLREWRHFFKLRTAKAAHPQMREVACILLDYARQLVPVVFEDIIIVED